MQKQKMILILLFLIIGKINDAQEVEVLGNYPTSTCGDFGRIVLATPNSIIDEVIIGDSIYTFTLPNDTVTISGLSQGVYDVLNAVVIGIDTILFKHFVIETQGPEFVYISSNGETCGQNGKIFGQGGLRTTNVDLYNDTWTLLGNTTVDAQRYWEFTSLVSGKYYLQVSDQFGCRAGGTISIDEAIPEVINKEITASSFCGNPIGTIKGTIASNLTITNIVSGGVVDFVGNSFEISEVTGIENVIITLTNNCIVSFQATIPEKEKVSYDMTISGVSQTNLHNGTVLLENIRGGAFPYEYYFHGGSLITPEVNSLPIGKDSLLIIDNDNCQTWSSFIIEDSPINTFAALPNGMRVGEQFDIIFKDGDQLFKKYTNANVLILSTNGKILSNTLPWSPTTSGTYYYIISLDGQTIVKKDLTVIN